MGSMGARHEGVKIAPILKGRAGLLGWSSFSQNLLMGNTFGHLFRITTFGESHGGGVGVVIDGCPPRLDISAAEIQFELDRRRPGQSKITTPRQETDTCEILSGVFEGQTLGTPIMILVRNKDARPQDYSEMVTAYRPSHADATYDAKYGIRNYQGGGRSSARETIGRVAAGAIAKKILRQVHGTEIIGYVKRIKDLEGNIDPQTVTLEEVEQNIVRCPDQTIAEEMIRLIETTGRSGDSVGGIVSEIILGGNPWNYYVRYKVLLKGGKSIEAYPNQLSTPR